MSTILRQRVPGIVTLKCNCHLCHLCSLEASLEWPKICEDVVRGSCTNFSRSLKIRETFKDFQKLVECEEHMIRTNKILADYKYAVSRVLGAARGIMAYLKELCESYPKTTQSFFADSKIR